MQPILLWIFTLFIINSFGQVGIGTTSPDATSSLDIISLNSGLLIPRVNLTNVSLISPIPTTPATSLLIWNTNASVIGGEGQGFYFWDGTKWVFLINTNTISSYITPHNTLDMAYDEGVAGGGRIITADSGNVLINGSDGFRTTGTITAGAYIGNTAGVQMFFNPRRGAFRAGSGTWMDVFPGSGNVGSYSVAMGFNNTASGQFALALVNGSSAEAESAVAIGNGARAVQQDDVAIGQSALANGSSATAIGESSEATGTSSIAIGSAAHSIGAQSTALGNSCQAEATNSTAIGFGSQAKGNESLAIGRGIRTDSYAEFSLGTNNTNGGGSKTAWVTTDRLLSIGNGETAATKSNALVILKNGNVGIDSDAPTSKLQVVGLPIVAFNTSDTQTNADAITSGLTIGAFYHTGNGIIRVVF